MNSPQFIWECVNSNDIVYMVSKRAGELANMKMDDLRHQLTSDKYGRVGFARSEFRGYSRGELIDHILTDEFVEDVARDLEELG
jgi:hypothetical protein